MSEFVKVVAANAALAKILRHPSGVHFREDLAAPVMWPFDQFTMRRLQDGDVTLYVEPPARPVRRGEGKGE